MSHYAVLNKQELQALLSHYDNGNILTYKVLSGGSENSNYLIQTAKNSFVLTICEQKSLKDAEDLAKLLIYLNHNNFTTSEIVKTKHGTLTTLFKNKPVMLKRYIEGDIIENLSEATLFNLGQELAKLHTINAPEYLPDSLSYGIDRFDDLQDIAANSSFYKWLKNTQVTIQKHISNDLPKALIHSDIFANNIIVNKNRNIATIMDFEEACYYYRVFDLGMMIVGTCTSQDKINVNTNKVSSLLKGYQQKIKLLDIEKNALKSFTVYAATATGFWRFQNFNYKNIIPSMKNHHLEMKNLADNIMKLPDDCFYHFL